MGADDYLLEALAGAVQGFGNVYIPRKQAEYENSILMQRQQAQSSADFNLFQKKLPLEQAKDIVVAQAKDQSKEHTIGEMYPSGTPRPSEFTPDLNNLTPTMASILLKNRTENSGKKVLLKSQAAEIARNGGTIPKDSVIIDDNQEPKGQTDKQSRFDELQSVISDVNALQKMYEKSSKGVAGGMANIASKIPIVGGVLTPDTKQYENTVGTTALNIQKVLTKSGRALGSGLQAETVSLPSANDSPEIGAKKFDEVYRKLMQRRDVLAKELGLSTENTSSLTSHKTNLLNDEDKQAIDWAKSNPNDPRSNAILKKINQKIGGTSGL